MSKQNRKAEPKKIEPAVRAQRCEICGCVCYDDVGGASHSFVRVVVEADGRTEEDFTMKLCPDHAVEVGLYISKMRIPKGHRTP